MSNLQFQDFGLNSQGGIDNPNFDIKNEEMDANNQPPPRLIGSFSIENEALKPKKNFFSFEFYQQYFDVNTDQVLNRIRCSLFPTLTSNFITDCIQPFPDLYGPFWICVTLIFSTSITAKLLKFFENNASIDFHDYSNDFRFVTGASTLIIFYIAMVPFCLYWFIWYRKVSIPYSYMELLCAYGYSLSIFIPVSILTLVNLHEFRWALILVSASLSGTVLARSMWCSFKDDRNKLVAIGVVTAVLLSHFILAVTFKQLYFKNSSADYPTFHFSSDKNFYGQNVNGSAGAALHVFPEIFQENQKMKKTMHIKIVTDQVENKVTTISSNIDNAKSIANDTLNLTENFEREKVLKGLGNDTKDLINSVGKLE